MRARQNGWLLAPATALALTACGGGGGSGTGVALTPPSPTPPPPAPPPTSPTPPPLPSAPIGLQSNAPFATVSAWTDGWGSLNTQTDAVKIAYSAAENRYTVTLPTYQEGRLVPRSGNGSFGSNGWINLSSTNSDLTLGAGPAIQQVIVTLDWPASSPFTYTSFGSWAGPLPMGEIQGVFAYGIPTLGADMPVTGSASYGGEIRGFTDGLPPGGSGSVAPLSVFGSVLLSFDFGAGTLSGQMNPEIAPVWDPVSLGTYTFRNTVYSSGSTTFSGAFSVPGSNSASSFSGRFTGPQAAELLANWTAPYIYPGTTHEGMMSGAWIAKRGN